MDDHAKGKEPLEAPSSSSSWSLEGWLKDLSRLKKLPLYDKYYDLLTKEALNTIEAWKEIERSNFVRLESP